jgi:ribulose-5-phosphate 4-epimerase/fuculose-1-phosphate aldolase
VSKRANAIIIKNHGLITLGRTLHEAYIRALIMEREAKAHIISRVMKQKPGYLSQKQMDSIINV